MYSLIILFHFVYNFLKSSVQNYLSRYDFFFFALDEPLHDLISFNFEIIPFSNGVDCFFSFLLVLYIFLFSCVDCLNWSAGLQHIKSIKFNIIPSFAINNVFFLDVLELGLTNRFIDLITDSFLLHSSNSLIKVLLFHICIIKVELLNHVLNLILAFSHIIRLLFLLNFGFASFFNLWCWRHYF